MTQALTILSRQPLRRILSPAALLALLCVGPYSLAQQPVSAPAAQSPEAEIQILPIRGNLYMLSGGRSNVTVQVGDEGVVLVDTLSSALTDQLLAAIRTLSNKPIRMIINTNAYPDHVGGNQAIAKTGRRTGGGTVAEVVRDARAGANVIAYETVLKSLRLSTPPVPFEGWPNSTYVTPSKDMFFNGEAVRILHLANAHTDGDSIVFFRRSDVLSVGDLVDIDQYPMIEPKNGGSLTGTIAALNKIIDLTVPAHTQEGGTMVVPGHGRLCDESDLVEYRDMLTLISSFVQEMIKEGRSLEQVVKAKPTAGFDTRYGFQSGPWTNDRFVEGVYRELKQGKARKQP